jgi:LCP family protein required for cell wall assembly
MSTYTRSGAPRDNFGDETAEVDAPVKAPKKRKGFRGMARWKRTLLILGIVLFMLVGGGAAAAYGLLSRYEGAVHHDDLMGDAAAPPAVTEEHWEGGPLNFLLLGSDSRAGETDKGVVAGERSDTIMLVHISAKRDSATIISIPRDSYVMIPESKGRKAGMNKLNAAFAFGGAPLAVKAVSQLTGITLDGAMIASFAGIRTMVDAVGGVEVCLDFDVKSTFSNTTWKKGCQQMDGKTAEEFMRNRKSVPGGDFGRMHDQQLVVRGIINKVSKGGLLENPLAFDKLLITAAQSLTIDKTIDLRTLAASVKNIRPDNVKFGTVPYSNDDLKTPAGSAVQLDEAQSKELFDAMRNDAMDAFFAAHPAPADKPVA